VCCEHPVMIKARRKTKIVFFMVFSLMRNIFFNHSTKGFNEVGVKLRTFAAAEFVKSFLWFFCGFVHSFGNHGAVGISNGCYAGEKGNFCAAFSVWVAVSIPPFMVEGYNVEDVIIEVFNGVEDLFANEGVEFYGLVLFSRKFPGLEEDFILDADLANIVEDSSSAEFFDAFFGEAKLFAEEFVVPCYIL